ncbi:TIGR00730 family Rossman fold protein [Hoeflea sp. YIM 152468]|uniref:LOG family protein n=1 Tax=Hoeflea sp. YIM 152468 TaxID=3031759 RepID=UPI0023DB1E0B|nr:TIGR00730 family Rossman fold protein [Hoeflea sp. YIM 152468]MDF1607764.1 TIGR00730 family Rossman fold protein [Hoeflea sp. YIM 152468]
MNKTSKSITSICVYCGSHPGHDPAYRNAASFLGRTMAENGIDLVYGGGTKGIMGAVAEAVMSHGGKVIGIIPEFLMDQEASREALTHLSELHVTQNMHERKHMMFERADAFVTLPGGIGTLEEIIEIMTWAQLGRHTKPMVLANINGFWDPLNVLLGHMGGQGFIHTAHLVGPMVIDRVEEIVPAIIASAVNGKGDPDLIKRM